MKLRIELTTLLLLGWSAHVVAQAPEEAEDELAPEEAPAEGPIEPEAAPAEGPIEEAAPGEGPVEETAPTAEGSAEAGVSVGGEIAGDASADAAATEAVAEPVPAGDSEEIVVTGSRIKRSSSFTTSAPVEVIDRKQLEYSGATNLSDVVQYLAVGSASGFRGGGAGAGTVAVNLRGLGPGATLVLLNGRRMVASGGGISNTGYSDLGVIPLSAVERIEVLKSGASAIYGSDAIGGVVNIITRRNLDGVRLQVDGTTTEEFDQREGTFSSAIGAVSERGRVMAAFNYFQSTELDANERDWTKGVYVSTTGKPASFGVGTVGTTVVDPACTMVPGSAPILSNDRQLCSWSYRDFVSLLGQAERANGISTGEYDITNHTTIFGEVLVSRLRSVGLSSPSYPIVPLGGFPTVPADHIDNPFGQNVSFIGRPLGSEAEGMRNTADDDTVRAVLGIKGDLEGAAADTLFETWEWELYASFGISRYRLMVNDVILSEFNRALNSCSDPNDLSNCFNPFYSSLDGTGTPNSDAVVERFSGALVNVTDQALQTYNAGMTGSLFELPGGDVGIAFGGEVRHESRASELDHDANIFAYGFLYGTSDAQASRDIYSGYLELRWPFFNGIELQTAGRVEHYTDIEESSLSPSAGLTLIPSEIMGRESAPKGIQRWQLRAQVTSAFRGPTMYASYPGVVSAPVALILPGSAVPVYNVVRTRGNPDLKAESAFVFTAGTSWQPIDELGLMLDYWQYSYKDRILPEIAQQIVSEWARNGMEDPRVIETPDGTISRVEAQVINFDGSVFTNGIDVGLNVTLTGATFGGGKDDWGSFSVSPYGTYTLAFDIPRGEAGNRILPDGMVLGPADCTGDDPDDDTCAIVGKRNNASAGGQAVGAGSGALPVIKLNTPITYANSGHAGTVTLHYMSGFEDDVLPNQDGSFDDVDAFMTLDLQYGYTLTDVIGDEMTFRIGCYNLLDKEPPSVNGLAAAFDPIHDPRGRMLYAKLSALF